MSTSLSFSQQLPAAPHTVFSQLSDPAVISACAKAANGPEAKVVAHNVYPGRMTVVTESPVSAAGVPVGLRPIFLNGAVGTKAETWTEGAASYDATFEITVPGAPAMLTCNATLVADGDGSRLDIVGTAEVKIPVLGGKIERMMVDQATERLAAEYGFLATRLT